jgi:hypothetical protein
MEFPDVLEQAKLIYTDKNQTMVMRLQSMMPRCKGKFLERRKYGGG